MLLCSESFWRRAPAEALREYRQVCRCLYNLSVRILLLNLYYPPDTSATAKMAQTVVDALSAAHEVTVVCGRPSYEPAERRPWRLWQTEEVSRAGGSDRVKIIRVGSTDYARTEMRRRVLNYLTYVALSVPLAALVPCDLVLGMTDPPFEGIVGAFVSLLKGKPFVYNLRDLYPDMAVGGSIVRAGPLTRVWEILHRWALRRATTVVALGEDMRARIVAKGVKAERVTVVRDGAEICKSGREPAVNPEVVRAIRGEFKFVLLHAGNLGFYGAWETLVDAARKLADDQVGLVFVGDGAQREQIEAAAGGCKNVRFLPFFPASNIASVLAAADAHIVTVKRGLEGVIVPSKMYGILAAGKPIVAVASRETDVAKIGEDRGFAVSADPDDAFQVAYRVRQIFGDAETLRRMGEAAKAAANDYDRVGELRKFLRIVEKARARDTLAQGLAAP
jgi:colanic acid biosynthesis glycosyl transferase WcaI